MTDIVHILIGFKGNISSIITVLKFDSDLPAVQFLFKDDYDRFETEAWIVKDENEFISVRVTPQDLYKEGDDVLFCSETGLKMIAEITYCDNDTTHGFHNVLYRMEAHKAMEYCLGSDILGKVTKK